MRQENETHSLDGLAPQAVARQLLKSEEREVMLGARVSTIIDAHEDALSTLIAHGFTLLSQAPMRWAMAHTVNLGQAFRLRGLGSAEQERLLLALAQLGLPARLQALAAGHGPHGD